MSNEYQRIGDSPILADGTIVPISPAVRAGNLLFVSGQLGMDDQGQVVSDDASDQARACVRRLQAIIELAGGTLGDIVKANIWVTDKRDFPDINRVWAEHFGDHPPARSTVVSDLLIEGARVEMDAIAVLENDSG